MAPPADDRPRSSATKRPGMGSLPFAGGTAFRVWAPHADGVAVAGDFNDWSPAAAPLAPEGGGYWSGEVPGARPGHRYEYVIRRGDGSELWRTDPYGRDVEHSNGATVIVDGAAFDWGEDADVFVMPPWNELVLYEMHIGTFNDQRPGDDAPGNLDAAIARLPHIVELGANAVQVMPLAEFPRDRSWGYNPSQIFAVESAYGGPFSFMAFVRAAHRLGLAVIVDVVYNHLGPSDLDLWQFDGWQENGKGGIYFYNDWRSATPWGDTRPDYGRGEVRQFLRDNALYWLGECRADGLRWDMTLFIRTVRGDQNDAGAALPDGWGLMQWVNREAASRWPHKITIAEDLQDNPWLTRAGEAGGAGFGAQWAANFVHPVRRALQVAEDGQRSMAALRDAILGRYDRPFDRVVYTESHDEVANGKARLPSEIDHADPGGWHARKRSTLGAVLVMTAPGIPMLFQGQEFLEDAWFRDDVPLDWGKKGRFAGIFRLYRDLVRCRRDRARFAGLQGEGTNLFHLNEADKVVALHRWDRGGSGDDVVVVLNLANRAHQGYVLGFPRGGRWRVRFNSDATCYGADFGNQPGDDTTAEPGSRDGLSFQASIGIGPYSALILTQDN